MNQAREIESGASPVTLAPPMVSVMDSVEIWVTTYWSTIMVITERNVLFFAVVPYECICGIPDKLPCCWERRWTLQGSQPCESWPVPFPLALFNCVFETINKWMQDPQIQSVWLPDGGMTSRTVHRGSGWTPIWADGGPGSSILEAGCYLHFLFKRKNLLILNNLIMCVYLCIWKKMFNLYPFYMYLNFCSIMYYFFFNLFIYFWLHWVFVAARGLSLVVVSRGYSSLRCTGFSLRWLLLLQSTGSRRVGFSSCGSWAQ